MTLPSYNIGRPIDSDDKYATIQVAAGTTENEVLSFQVKPGKKAFIGAIRSNRDSGGIDYVKFHAYVNGSRLNPPFDASLNQWASCEQDVWLPVPIEIPQLSTVRITADNLDPSNSHTATARVIVIYEDYPDARL